MLDLPILTTLDNAANVINLRSGSVLNANAMTRFNNGDFQFENGPTLNATLLRDISGSNLALGFGMNFNSGKLTQVDNSRVSIQDGVTFDKITASSYAHNRNATETIFEASGIGSTLDLSSLQSLNYTTGGALRGKTIIATEDAMINLSGLQKIDINSGDDDILTFKIATGGSINLSALSSINPLGGNSNNAVRFELEEDRSFTLGSLLRGKNIQLYLDNFTTLNLPTLTTIDNANNIINLRSGSVLNADAMTRFNSGAFQLENGSTLNATSLLDIEGSQLTLGLGMNFNTAALTEIDNARIAIQDGIAFDKVTATSYLHSRNASETIFSATGVGSALDLSSIQSLNYTTGGALRGKVISATEDAVIDLSGLQRVDINAGDDDILTFVASTGGEIRLNSLSSVNSNIGNANNKTNFQVSGGSKLTLGEIQASSRFEIQAEDLDSEVEVMGNLRIDQSSSLSFDTGAKLLVHGDFVREQTNQASAMMDEGIIQFASDQLVELELASENRGGVSDVRNNFGFKQLQVGTDASPTTLILADRVDNGNRTDGAPETQYLLGLAGQGLILNNQSIVILNGYDLFFTNSSSSFGSIRDQFGEGQKTIAFGGGFISLTAETGDLINGDFETRDLKGFRILGPGQARIKTTDRDRLALMRSIWVYCGFVMILW